MLEPEAVMDCLRGLPSAVRSKATRHDSAQGGSVGREPVDRRVARVKEMGEENKESACRNASRRHCRDDPFTRLFSLP